MACAGLRADLPEWKFPSRTFRGLEQDCQKNMVKDGCELLQAQYVNLPQKVELREGSTSATPVTHPCDGRHNDFHRRSPKPEPHFRQIRPEVGYLSDVKITRWCTCRSR